MLRLILHSHTESAAAHAAHVEQVHLAALQRDYAITHPLEPLPPEVGLSLVLALAFTYQSFTAWHVLSCCFCSWRPGLPRVAVPVALEPLDTRARAAA